MTIYAPQNPSPLQISTCHSSPLPPLSQFSPSTPSALLAASFPPYSPYLSTTTSQRPPPQLPPLWTWSCHQCHSSYPLGATRRCLQDGHYFCSGTTVNKNTGRSKRHKPCGSVFDYVGWRAWGDWRREATVAQPRRRQSLQLSIRGRKESRHNCAEECDFPSECRWAARLSPGTKASKTGIVSPVAEESEEGMVDAELDDVMEDALEVDMEKEPPSPSSPVSPTFSIGDKSPTSPRESQSLLEKLILSTERRKSRDLAPEAVEAKAERGAGAGLAFPVSDFRTFKAGMDRAHGVVGRGTGSSDAGREGNVTPAGRDDGTLFEAEAEGMDIDSLVPPRRMGTGAPSDPRAGVIGDGGSGGDSMEDVDGEKWEGEVEVVEVVEAGGRFIQVMRVETGTVGAPRSPRRGAWDWSIGGLGAAMAFADVGMDFEMMG